MALKLLSYLYGTMTQGGADAFVQASIATPLANASGFAATVREIVIEWPRISVAASVNMELALTRKTLAAMPNITEKSLIQKWKYAVDMATSGAIFNPTGVLINQYADDVAPLIVESTIYCQLDSNATTLTGTAYIRIGYTLDKIADVDRLNIIAASLQT